MSIAQSERDLIAEQYLEQLEFEPYPVQEDALFNWFASEQGIMVCAPTGTGKTLIAEAAIFEALKLGRQAYYTTPLIALTDQKFRELQVTVARWGFHPNDVGLVTGNRKVNPEAPIQVVVAEILLNRLLHREAFDFSNVWAIVMDEFHSFNDLERGIVWEFGLALLPKQVKTLLLSATVGNAYEFSRWLEIRHQRSLKLIESFDRKVPLTYQWVPDQLLDEQIESMFRPDGQGRMTPALIFCFNREQCWTVAELLKGKKVVDTAQQKTLADRLQEFDWSQGAGPKLKQILIRGVGVHHAGVLPKYRRIVEQLFQDKLLSVCVCTETLAAGINLPARSVVLPTILKGPPGKMKLIEPSDAHQMFGRAGRPQFDDQGFVFVLAHEDDVKILRAQEKLNQIPEDTRDPGLLNARKALKKKMPKRREGVQYWSEPQFQQLIRSKPADLQSRGPLTWRLLAWLLDANSDVNLIRQLVSRRLLKGTGVEQAERQLQRMLLTLHRAGFVVLSPAPPPHLVQTDPWQANSVAGSNSSATDSDEPSGAEANGDSSNESLMGSHANPAATGSGSASMKLDLGQRQPSKVEKLPVNQGGAPGDKKSKSVTPSSTVASDYWPDRAEPQANLAKLVQLKGVHPLFAWFLMSHLGAADRNEKIQALEALLELPGSLSRAVDVPDLEALPNGPLAVERLNPRLLTLGLATVDELSGPQPDEDPRDWRERFVDGPPRILSLAHKLQRLFQFEYPGVDDLRVRPCWVAGEVLTFGGDFNKYITSYQLQKQEGMIFRHLLRMVLLIDEMAMLVPADGTQADWQEELGNIAYDLETCCRQVDEHSTNQWLDESRQG